MDLGAEAYRKTSSEPAGESGRRVILYKGRLVTSALPTLNSAWKVFGKSPLKTKVFEAKTNHSENRRGAWRRVEFLKGE